MYIMKTKPYLYSTQNRDPLVRRRYIHHNHYILRRE